MIHGEMENRNDFAMTICGSLLVAPRTQVSVLETVPLHGAVTVDLERVEKCYRCIDCNFMTVSVDAMHAHQDRRGREKRGKKCA